MTPKNECLIDWFRFSIPSQSAKEVINNILGLQYSKFSYEGKGSPYPSYDKKITYANIEVHTSNQHDKTLVNLSGQACRQYEEYMSAIDGWHWHEFIKVILRSNGNVTRIDLALDIFDNSSPSVKVIQDYVKRGQLSSRSQTFKEINSGRILDGVLNGFTIYIGALPQMLRIYDKKQELKDNSSTLVNVESWIRWELELSDKKAMETAKHISNAKPLNMIIRGILSAHYAFKTQPKGKKDFHNKARWSNMRWWDKFIENLPQIPLRVMKEKPTMEKKAKWLNYGVSKSLAMQYQAYGDAFGEEDANAYITELLTNGTDKFSVNDLAMIEQKVHELISEDEY
jgi:phage replication initiation protein